jgi:hypothetical protein
MRTSRIAEKTRRSPRVTALALGACLFLSAGGAGARAEETAPIGLARELRQVVRRDLPLEDRVGAAKRALAVERGGDATAWANAGMALLHADSDGSCRFPTRPRGWRPGRTSTPGCNRC